MKGVFAGVPGGVGGLPSTSPCVSAASVRGLRNIAGVGTFRGLDVGVLDWKAGVSWRQSADRVNALLNDVRIYEKLSIYMYISYMY